MQQRFLVTYDIRDPKRLRAVFRLMKGYGDHLQFSVFRCDLGRMELVRLKTELSAIINCDQDQVLIIDVGPSDGRGAEVFESLGRAYVEREEGPTII